MESLIDPDIAFFPFSPLAALSHSILLSGFSLFFLFCQSFPHPIPISVVSRLKHVWRKGGNEGAGRGSWELMSSFVRAVGIRPAELVAPREGRGKREPLFKTELSMQPSAKILHKS